MAKNKIEKSWLAVCVFAAPLSVLLFAQCGSVAFMGGPIDDGGMSADFGVGTVVPDAGDAGAWDAALPADDMPDFLGSARSFAVLGGQTVTSTGGTNITGNLGVSPGITLTGFPPATVATGAIHLGDAVALQAQLDLITAYNALKAQACTVNLTGQELSGLVLKPGVYCFSTSAAISLVSNLILDAQGNPNAVFIFQIGSTLTTGNNTAVKVINGGSDCNVYWQVGSSATVGVGTALAGNIIALSSITLQTGATLSGRALTQNAAVSLDNNAVSFATCAAVPPTADLAITVTSGQPSAAPGSTFAYLVSVFNRGPNQVQNATVTTQFIASGGPAPTPVAWTCTATASSSCAMPSGSGDATTKLSLTVGGSAVFIVAVTVPAQGAGLLGYRAQVAPSVTVPDPNLANNSATAVLSIPEAGTDMRSGDASAEMNQQKKTLAGGGFSCNTTGRGSSSEAVFWLGMLLLGTLTRRFRPRASRRLEFLVA